MKVTLLRRRSVLLFTMLITLFALVQIAIGQIRTRNEINIPDIPGYVTLKCDFHMHTVFSDGTVWPSVRVEEAWLEGLDAISITDHIEYQPHKSDIPTNHNRPYELALARAKELDILLVRGSEITRSMPPGHLNAIFLKDCQPLETDNYMDAIKAAIDQGAFVFWNHPGWTGQQPDGVSRWYEDHTTLYEKGWLHGIEVVNFGEYYPEVHDWCNEKKLTFIGSSDVHSPINLDYNFQAGEHRPMTLVFAEEWTLDALKEALFEQRTVVYVDKRLIGADSYLKPIFDESIQIRTLHASLPANGSANIQIHNSSGITFELFAEEGENLVRGPQHITLYPGKTVIARIRGTSTQTTGVKNVTLPYRVQNLLVTPEQGLSVELQFTVTFIPRQD